MIEVFPNAKTRELNRSRTGVLSTGFTLILSNLNHCVLIVLTVLGSLKKKALLRCPQKYCETCDVIIAF